MKLETFTAQIKTENPATEISHLNAVIAVGIATETIQNANIAINSSEKVFCLKPEGGTQSEFDQTVINCDGRNNNHFNRLCGHYRRYADNKIAGIIPILVWDAFSRYYHYRNTICGNVTTDWINCEICKSERFKRLMGKRYLRRYGEYSNNRQLQSLPDDKDGWLCTL
jgi:hypothetical protein